MRQGLLLLLPIIIFSTGCSREKFPPNNRTVADWAISRGGAVTLVGQKEELRDTNLLPHKPFGIAAIEFTNADLTGKDFKRLAEISKLDRLSLYGTKISDEEIDFLLGIDSLSELELSSTEITDKALKKLHKFKTLKKLYLHNTLVTKQGVDEFQRIHPGCTVFADPAN